MSLTPNRDAVDASAFEARQRHAGELAREGAPGIGRRMAIETSEAIHGGMADMLDRHIALDAIWPQVAAAYARSLSGLLMTVAGGDPALAEAMLSGSLASIEEIAVLRLRGQGDPWSVGKARATGPAGRA